MPYSLGTDKLEKVDPDKIKSKLSEDVERKLETDMRELYDRLLPTEAIEVNRRELVSKLERLFNTEWPGHDIRVHLFGSSGNLLCSDDSDGTWLFRRGRRSLSGEKIALTCLSGYLHNHPMAGAGERVHDCRAA
jgi:hypothetical protein